MDECPFCFTELVNRMTLNNHLKICERLYGLCLKINGYPREIKMNTWISRYYTFKKEWTYPNRVQLASNGFWYTGTLDFVSCFWCNVTIGEWEPEDDVVKDHFKHNPYCMIAKVNFKLLEIQGVHNISRRLRTFVNWPKQKSIVLAHCGFYYEENNITCFWCKGNLAQLSKNPIELHLEPDCEFAQGMKSKYDEMKKEKNRLQTFDTWTNPIDPKDLSEVGFFYLQESDWVQCAYCLVVINDWTLKKSPLREHIRNNPLCPLMKGSCLENHEDEKRDLRLTCKVCFTKEIETIYLNCGHIVCCSSCSQQLEKCPICRKPIVKKQRAYLI